MDIDLSLFSDLLVVHELAHQYHGQVPFRFPRELLNELFPNYCLHAYIDKCEPDFLPILLTYPRILSSISDEHFPCKNWEDYEYLPIDAIAGDNYAWLQAKLHMIVNEVYQESGIAPLKRLYTQFALDNQKLFTLLSEQVDERLSSLLKEANG